MVTASADKMNVLWVGLDNPVSLEAENIDYSSIKILVSGSKAIFSGDNGRYTIKPYEPGEVRLLVLNEVGLRVAKSTFRARRIPDPLARLADRLGGKIPMGEFRAQRGINASIDNFDYDAYCEIMGFEMTHIGNDGVSSSAANEGRFFTEASAGIISAARPGDYFLFNNVRARCPGDRADRRLNSLAFTLR